jgi:hypothetical protein
MKFKTQNQTQSKAPINSFFVLLNKLNIDLLTKKDAKPSVSQIETAHRNFLNGNASTSNTKGFCDFLPSNSWSWFSRI